MYPSHRSIKVWIKVFLITVIWVHPTTAWKRNLFAPFRLHRNKSSSPSNNVNLNGRRFTSIPCGEDLSSESSSSKVIVKPHIEYPSISSLAETTGRQKQKALIFVDAFSPFHALYMAERARDVYGLATIHVLSNYMQGYFLKTNDDLDRKMAMAIPTNLEEWLAPVDVDIVGIYCESDSGLADAEHFGAMLKLKQHNDINEARRNKYLMNEALKTAGLPVVKQRLCRTLEEAYDFVQYLTREANGNENPKIIVKPIRGVGSDDVFLCDDMDAVTEAFNAIHGSYIFGSPTETHDSVLLQEYAIGQEYSLDVVSRNGEHKVAAIWKYDKRSVNGAPFVYFATKLYDGPDSEVIADYTKNALDALGMKWGLSHNEVIMTENGIRLVEVNCRQHNMDFLPLTMCCIGYNALDMLLSAYVSNDDSDGIANDGTNIHPDGTRWNDIPDLPSLRMNGAMMHLVNYQDGTLAGINEQGLMEIQGMESTMDLEVYGSFLEIGAEISPTKDICTDAGWVQIVNPDPETFERNYRRIVELMPDLFSVEDQR